MLFAQPPQACEFESFITIFSCVSSSEKLSSKTYGYYHAGVILLVDMFCAPLPPPVANIQPCTLSCALTPSVPTQSCSNHIGWIRQATPKAAGCDTFEDNLNSVPVCLTAEIYNKTAKVLR